MSTARWISTAPADVYRTVDLYRTLGRGIMRALIGNGRCRMATSIAFHCTPGRATLDFSDSIAATMASTPSARDATDRPPDRLLMSVSMKPGTRVVTAIPVPASSAANPSPSAESPALLAEYAVMGPASPRSALIEDTRTRCPLRVGTDCPYRTVSKLDFMVDARDPVVTTADGAVRGQRAGAVINWRGIPFAAPPVGPLRLRRPQPVEPWSGVREARNFGHAARQPVARPPLGPWFGQTTSEDCLTLNVTAPADRGDGPLPVTVFIHGGGYIAGSSASPMYRAESLVRRGVVYVSLNYRLGALGVIDFSAFSTPERPIDSNLALRDQIAALEWVHRSIAAFGGDPDNVTIFGESAGGGSVAGLLAAPAAAGLFHRAIAQSPIPDFFMTGDVTRDWGRRIVAALGADVDGDPRMVAETLEQAPFEDLARATSRVAGKLLQDEGGRFLYSLAIDGDVLPSHPITACAEGTAHPVPLIVGTNHDEHTLFEYTLKFLPNRSNRLRRLFAATDPRREGRVVSQYPGYPHKRAAARIGGDYAFWAPTVNLASAHSRHAPTYMYRYDFALRAARLIGLGATHASELFAVFGSFGTRWGWPLTAGVDAWSAARVTRLVQRHWLQFARTGAPDSSWPAYTEQRRATLIIDRKPTVANDPDQAKRLAWDGYPGHLGHSPLPDVPTPEPRIAPQQTADATT